MNEIQEELNIIREDLAGALITLGVNSLSESDKIKECDKIICETYKYIESLIIKYK